MSSYIGRQLNNLSDRVKLDSITASATATYNLLLNTVAYVPSSAESLTVSLNGVIQAPQDSYTVSGSTITFASTLSASDSIDFILAERSITLQTPSSGSVNTEQLASGSVTAPKLSSTAVDNTNTNSTLITAQTEKTSLVDADKFLISDSASSGALKYVQKSNLGAGGLVYVAGASTSSNVATVDINGCFSATYRNYLLIFDYTPSSNGANPKIRFKDTSNNAITSSQYSYAFSGQDFAGGAENTVGNDVDAFQVGQGTTNNENTDFPAMSGVLHILNPFSSSNNVNYMGTLLNRGNKGEFRAYAGAGRYDLQTQIAGLQFYFSTGNVNNLTAKVYGIVDS